MKVLNKLFAPILKSGIRNLGNLGSALSMGDVTAKINIIKLTNSCVITLPEFPATESVTFMFKVLQDATGGRNLTINDSNGNAAYNLTETDFTAGTANQKCWVTVLWDGTNLCFTATNYVD